MVELRLARIYVAKRLANKYECRTHKAFICSVLSLLRLVISTSLAPFNPLAQLVQNDSVRSVPLSPTGPLLHEMR